MMPHQLPSSFAPPRMALVDDNEIKIVGWIFAKYPSTGSGQAPSTGSGQHLRQAQGMSTGSRAPARPGQATIDRLRAGTLRQADVVSLPNHQGRFL